MKMIRLLSCVSVLFWCVSSHGYSEPGQSLGHQPLVYVHPNVPVISRINSMGEQVNPVLHMTNAMFHTAGFPWTSRPVPISRMYHYLNRGKANFSILVKTAKLDRCCITSENPVYKMELGLYQKPETPYIYDLNEMKGKSFIHIEGYAFGSLKEFIFDKKNNITLYPATNHKSAFAMLAAGRAHYFLDYRGPAQMVEEEKAQNGFIYNVFKNIELYLVLDKNYPNAPSVVSKLEGIFNSLNEEDFIN
ncbi:MAG: hypothetical protein K6L80_02885 [Agarilytica sp.]